MKNQNFWIRSASLLIAVAALLGYQSSALEWEREEAANAKAIAEAEANNALYSDEQTHASYRDGTYTGTGDGFGGTIEVEVTVKDQKIAAIEILSADGEDAAYLENASGVIEKITKEQTTEVDTMSGATFSSIGIMKATENALEEAVE